MCVYVVCVRHAFTVKQCMVIHLAAEGMDKHTTHGQAKQSKFDQN